MASGSAERAAGGAWALLSTAAYLLALLINGASYTSSSTIRVYGR